MARLQAIWKAYEQIDEFLLRKEEAARSSRGRQVWANRRVLNDHAYFVMLFACFEDRATALCRKLVDRKQAKRSWRERRLWDQVDLDRVQNMPLMRRVALLLDKGSADHRDVVELYDLRNRIAHGAAELVGPTNLRLHYQRIARLWRVLRP